MQVDQARHSLVQNTLLLGGAGAIAVGAGTRIATTGALNSLVDDASRAASRLGTLRTAGTIAIVAGAAAFTGALLLGIANGQGPSAFPGDDPAPNRPWSMPGDQ